MITKNAQEVIEEALKSVENLVNEIVIIDNYSVDKTVKIAKKYQAKIFFNKEKDFGKQKKFAVHQASSKWILVLDSDERVSSQLKQEIKSLFKTHLVDRFDGFYIPFQNHFLGKPINYGGENYQKIRLFKKNKAVIAKALVHEKFNIKTGKTGKLKGKIYHYSYRSLFQMYKKFTDYGFREAKQKKVKGEKSSLKKIFIYPLHMFWARFIKDKGYKDGFFRVPLDLGFAYMEFLTYFLIIF